MVGAWLAAGCVESVAAVLHSAVGERYVVRDVLLADRQVTTHPDGRATIRIAWHMTSGLLAVVAFILFRAAIDPAAADRIVLAAIGILLFMSGIALGVMTRFKHWTWPFQTICGALTLAPILTA